MTTANHTWANHLKSCKLPIFFLQLGSNRRSFIKNVVKQAELTNGKENVFFLTDTDFHLYKEFNCIDVAEYMEQSNAFDLVYKHHSTNSYLFEKSCFNRWYIINQLVTAHKIEHFFYADCDVLIYTSMLTQNEMLLQNGYEGAMIFIEHNGKTIASPHSSFWSRALLNEFCRFTYNTYALQTEYSKLIEGINNKEFFDNENISDMVLVDLFRLQSKRTTFNLLTLENEGICFDWNINLGYNGYKNTYELHPVRLIKKAYRRAGGVFGKINTDSAPAYVQFNTLHFQGLSKPFIPLYVTSGSVFQYLSNRYGYFKNHLRLKRKAIKASLKGNSN
jgi:hypothetical protein